MRVGLVAGALLLALVAPAPATARWAVPDQAERTPPHFVRSVLTADASKLRIAGDPGGRVDMTASSHDPKQADWNRREVFRRSDSKVTPDQRSCATWVSESSENVQEGLAVRIRQSGSGRVRAITLTKNTIFNVHTIINVLTWDTRRAGDPWATVGQFDMAEALVTDEGELQPFPWRVCLRAIGSTVSFKLWFPDAMTEPPWSNPTYARSAALPAGFTAAGRPGWYVGHVPARGEVVYDDLTTRSFR